MPSVFRQLYQGIPAQLSPPTLSTTATATSGGTLAAQQWNVSVSSVDASGNETTVSSELAQVTTGSTSTVTVNWAAATGAANYKVYLRNPVTGTAAGLVTTVSGATLTCIITSATVTSAPPAVNGTGETTLATCPAATTWLVKQITIANNNQQAATAAISIVPSAGTGGPNNRIIPQLSEVRANSVRTFDLNQALTAGMFLSGVVSTTGVVVTISGLVQT